MNVLEDGFQSVIDDFLNAHYHHFDEDEENKLIYTDIFNQYVSITLVMLLLLKAAVRLLLMEGGGRTHKMIM